MPGLLKFIQKAVEPSSWKSNENPESIGVVEDLLPAGKSILRSKTANKTATDSVVIDQTVLVITQTRDHHRAIADIIRRVENGDERPIEPGLGGAGGGFGGGFFSIDEQKRGKQ